MGEYSDKSAENKSTIVSNQVLQQHKPQAASQFADRPEAIVQMKLQDIANNSTRVLQLSALF